MNLDQQHPQKAPPSEGGGGYGYYGYAGGYKAGGYGYGYGYGYGETSAQKHFENYLLILRERIWYIVVVFLVVFSSALVYTVSQTKLYRSIASVQILRRDPVVMQVQGVVENEIRSSEDLNTQIKVLESMAIVEKVAQRLTGDDLRQFMAPYENGGEGEAPSLTRLLFLNHKIVPLRLSLVLTVQYTHPDPLIAAKVANLFIDEYINYNSRVRIDESMKAVEDLKLRAEDQRKKVEQLGYTLQAYREKNNLVSLDQRRDIVTEKLKQLNLNLTQAHVRLKEAEVRWNQIKERREKAVDLTELSFIAGLPNISQLVQQVSSQKIVIAQLRERYRDKHPKMIEAANSLSQIERELTRALDSAAATIEGEYQNAQRNNEDARVALANQEEESLKLDHFAVEYSNLERELNLNEQFLQSILGRMRETSMAGTIETQNARIVDHALPSGIPASPNVLLNLGLGLVGGIGLGFAFAFFVAFLDDRVKSSFDIESVVGVPLIGIIPQIKRMEQPDKAQIAINNADRQVSEAFLALHSGLRLKDESKNAQCILITSTVPGEGKSFMTTNLALTFAAHGERVIIVDGDLRKPNIHKSFRIDDVKKGLIDFCAGTASLDEVIIKGIHPTLDIISAGGRAKNPTQILNSKNFENLIAELRKRYDRVFVDTPPLAAVSDALIVLPLMDGSLFTIFFNRVRRKAAQFSAKKLIESNVPVFGAVLNGLNIAVSGYYYAQYYDKSYKDYYVVMSKSESTKSR